MEFIAWICLSWGLVVQAAPLSKEDALEIRNNENIHIITGEPARDRTIFVVVAIFCTTILAFLLGSRIRRLNRGIRSRRNFMAPLLLAIYITVACYIIISAALVSGQGLYTYKLCDAGTWVCLMFYIMAKGFVYAFLVERVHIVRAPFVSRGKDKVYIACLVPAMIMYTGISLNSYFWRVTAMHESDGRCHFGIESQASIPILSVNIITNVGLTGVFFYLLRPIIKLHGMPTVSAALSRTSKTEPVIARGETAVQRNIKTLLTKSIIGAILIELPVAANMIQFLVTGGRELGMMCLAFCMGDVFWDALVIHWLTFGSSAAAEKDLLRSTDASSRRALTRQQSNTPSRASSQREVREVPVKAPEPAFAQAPDPEMAICHESAKGPFSLRR
ncbi:uncharacterized protein M421DRAFT_425280 [Didymella exigua CBS 183.55]|uniref:G-protein coupled receptors family 1 profile domain-containing protein n=1 Tax=Didymella exigua CBS 183.55 TaxID=1150837 RepID=A0A6A5R9D2_9PLEO|nr:uncharacterized protein M421DRAFT_425280 [Didymella exigua CBS 183.55]KAF1923939.1 hypothetical protein M421DRAFT_425280 [Didymella exigua CBS 183.55]